MRGREGKRKDGREGERGREAVREGEREGRRGSPLSVTGGGRIIEISTYVFLVYCNENHGRRSRGV